MSRPIFDSSVPKSSPFGRLSSPFGRLSSPWGHPSSPQRCLSLVLIKLVSLFAILQCFNSNASFCFFSVQVVLLRGGDWRRRLRLDEY